MQPGFGSGVLSEPSVVPIERLELEFAPQPWPFAEQHRAEIDTRFADRQRSNPALWNGRVLVLHRHAITASVFHGAFLAVDYASFLTWQDLSFPETGVRNCFAQGALLGTDGAYLLGVMAPHTANPGRIYFPSGTPDPSDVVGDRVDLDGSVWREVTEETGLTAADLAADPGWCTVLSGPRIAHIRTLRAREPAAALRQRILGLLARERQPELCDIRIVRGPSDIDPMMPDFIHAFLAHAWTTRP